MRHWQKWSQLKDTNDAMVQLHSILQATDGFRDHTGPIWWEEGTYGDIRQFVIGFPSQHRPQVGDAFISINAQPGFIRVWVIDGDERFPHEPVDFAWPEQESILNTLRTYTVLAAISAEQMEQQRRAL